MKRIILLLSCLILVFVQASPVIAQADQAVQTTKVSGIEGLEERIRQLEEAVKGNPEGANWYDRIQVSGVVEVEASYMETDFKDPATADQDQSDVDVSAVELAIDSEIAKHVSGHVLFKYEDNDVFLDEGFIALYGSDSLPAYLIAGRQYVPFGCYDSHFVTDPNTLILGETNEGAVVAGYRFGG